MKGEGLQPANSKHLMLVSGSSQALRQWARPLTQSSSSESRARASTCLLGSLQPCGSLQPHELLLTPVIQTTEGPCQVATMMPEP